MALRRRVGTAVVSARRDGRRALEVWAGGQAWRDANNASPLDEGDAEWKAQGGPQRHGDYSTKRQTKIKSQSQMSKDRQPAVAVHWFAQPCASYRPILIQFSVKDVAFCAMAAWLLATKR